MKNLKTIFYLLMVLFSISCVSEDSLDTGEIDIKFVMYADDLQNSRVTTDDNYKTTFQSGDAVGVFAFLCNEDGTDGERIALNAKYTFDGNSWKAENGDIKISRDKGSVVKLNFYAYFPYDKNTVNHNRLERKVEIEQRDVENYNSSDLMVAKSLAFEVTDNAAPVVGLAFSHALSVVEVNVVGTEAVYQDGLSVRLRGLSLSYNYDINTGSTTLTSTQEEDYVRMLSISTVSGNMVYRAVVPSQNIAAESELIYIVNGTKADSYKTVSEITLNPGKVRKLKIQKGDIVENVIVDCGENNIAWDTSGESQELAQSGVELKPVEEVIFSFDENTVFPNCDFQEWYDGDEWWKKSTVKGEATSELEVVINNEYLEVFNNSMLQLAPGSRSGLGYGIGYNSPSGIYAGKYKLIFDGTFITRNTLYVIVSSVVNDERIYFPIYLDEEVSDPEICKRTDDGALGIIYDKLSPVKEVNQENKTHELIIDLNKKYTEKETNTVAEVSGDVNTLSVRFAPASKVDVLLGNIRLEQIP